MSSAPQIARNTICLWFDGGAEDAARFYAAIDVARKG